MNVFEQIKKLEIERVDFERDHDKKMQKFIFKISSQFEIIPFISKAGPAFRIQDYSVHRSSVFNLEEAIKLKDYLNEVLK